MVHNGIEYAMMQLIAETYDILRRAGGLDNNRIREIFDKWNEGQLQSYLIQITAEVFKTLDKESNTFLVDLVLDKAGSKGTGKWTSQSAMDLAVPIPVIDTAVAMRNLSIYKEDRTKAASIYKPRSEKINVDEAFLTDLENALAFSFIIAYAQGLNQLAKASIELKMDIPLPSVIRVWKAGCIIRSALLGNFSAAYNRDQFLSNLLLDSDIALLIKEREQSARNLTAAAMRAGIPVAALASTVTYFDAYCSERLPTNLIQAQRDYFGAHTYQRIDREGVFHTEWHESE
jgi:6-phosphogluconate dehydrogenase